MRREHDEARTAVVPAVRKARDTHLPPLLALQRAAGNQAVLTLLPAVQRCGGDLFGNGQGSA